MVDSPKILLLYARFGEGHYQVSKALQQQFFNQGIYNVKLVNLFEEAHPFWNAVFKFFYSKSSLYFPKIYGWSYRVTHQMRSDGRFGKWLHSFGMQQLEAIMKIEQPDAVIHTFPFLAMCELRQTSGNRTPCFTVITDFMLHSRWIHPETDGYFVATEELKEALLARGVKENQIMVSGIPIRSVFEHPVLRADTYEKYGLKRHKTYVLLLGGVYGVLSNLEIMIKDLLQQNEELGFIVVAGRDSRLYRKLRALFSDFIDVKVLEYVEDIEQLMLIASCIVTKAGGITLTEAQSLRIPVIVYRPLPGQEQENADFWGNKGALLVARDISGLKISILHQLACHEDARQTKAADYDGCASRTIADAVLGRIAEDAAWYQPMNAKQHGRQITHEYS